MIAFCMKQHYVIEALIKLVFGFKIFRLNLKSIPVCTPFECYTFIPSQIGYLILIYVCYLLPWEVFTCWTNIGSSKFFLNMHQKNWKSSSKSALATAYLCININFNPEMEWNIIFSPLSHGNWVTFWLRCLVSSDPNQIA